MTAVVVATTLVSEARSKTVSTVIGSAGGATAPVRMPFVEHGVASAHHHDGARHPPVGDGAGDDGVDFGQNGCVHPGWRGPQSSLGRAVGGRHDGPTGVVPGLAPATPNSTTRTATIGVFVST